MSFCVCFVLWAGHLVNQARTYLWPGKKIIMEKRKSTSEAVAEIQAELAKGEECDRDKVMCALDDVMKNEFDKHEEVVVGPKGKEVLKRMFPSPDEFLAALLGAALSGALTLADLATGTIAGVIGSRVVDITLTRIREWHGSTRMHDAPRWRDDYCVSDEDLAEVSRIVKHVVSTVNEIPEAERRVYQLAAKNVYKQGISGRLAIAVM